MHELTLDGHGGGLHCRHWPVGDAVGVVVVVHGYAEHGGRYAHCAQRWTGQGWSVYAPDHVGHGHSDGERALIADFEAVVDDLELVVARAERAHPDRPVVMVGHSMGGLLTARFAQRHPRRLAGVVFLGAVLGDWAWAREVLALPELPAVDSDPAGMSRDPDAVRAYTEDPLVYHGTYKRPLLEAEVRCLDTMRAQLDRIDVPVLCLHGEDDPFVPPGPTVAAVEAMASTDKTVITYPGARHELVNETNADEVLAAIEAFLARLSGT